MAALTLPLGTAEGVALSVTYDDRTGVLSKVTLTNPAGMVVSATVAATGGVPFEVLTKVTGDFAIPKARQPTLTLDAEKRPANLDFSFAVCPHTEVH